MRTKNSIINISSGFLAQIFSQLLSFVSRTVFIYFLGAEYLGINGLFSNILSILSLAELGVSTAMLYHLYKPLAYNNETKVRALMDLYKKMYFCIGIFIFLAGMLLMPFLDILIKDIPDISGINLIYFLFLINSSTSYFYAYKQSLLSADQKQYIINLQTQKYKLIITMLQVLVLILFRSFILYLLVNIVLTILNNRTLAKIVDRNYSYINNGDKTKLSKEELKDVYRYIGAGFFHKIGSVIVTSTDNLLISSFVGVVYVGIVSNYVLLLNLINTFLSQIFIGLTGSIGNLVATDNNKSAENLFFNIFYVNNFLVTIAFITFINCSNIFIKSWIGSEYVLPLGLVLLMGVNFYLRQVRNPGLMFIATMGLNWQSRYVPLFEASINLLVSLILLRVYGLPGVFLGTLISTLLTVQWTEPMILFRFGFSSKLRRITFKYILNYSLAVLSLIVTLKLNNYVFVTNLATFLLVTINSILITIFIIVFFTFKTKEFRYVIDMTKTLIKRIS